MKKRKVEYFEVRAARSRAEFDAMIKNAALAFADNHVDEETFRRQNLHSPGRRLCDTRIALVDGEIVGALNVLRRSIDVADASIPTGAIADVHVKSEYRGSGYGYAILDDALSYMAKRGDALSLLCSDKRDFYGQRGWTPIPRPHYVLDSRTPLFPVPDRYKVRRVALDEAIALLQQISTANKIAYTGCFRRAPTYWKALPKWKQRGKLSCYAVFERESPVAACVLEKKNGQLWIHECRNLAGHYEAPKNLLRAALVETRRRRLDALCGNLPETHPAAVKIILLGGRRTVFSELMGQVIDLDDVTRRLLPAYQKRLQNSISVPDGKYFLKVGNKGAMRYAWRGGKLSICNDRVTKNTHSGNISDAEFLTRLLGVSAFHVKQYSRLPALFETVLAPQDYVFWDLDCF